MHRVLCLLLAASLATSAWPASVTLHPNGAFVVLEGRIEPGDLEKVARISRASSPTGIYLASPGGNLAEAIRIGALVRRLAWETRSLDGPDVPAALRVGVARSHGVRDVARNGMCASACFFIFIAGIYRDGHALGIHQPFMSPDELERMSSDEAERRANSVRALVEWYLAKMGVPRKYADEMYAVPKESMRWLTHDEVEADFQGFIPQVRHWVETQCGDQWKTRRCKEDVMLGIRLRALEEARR
jgi:hypothetical protein